MQKNTGIVRGLDKLGRIVIPIEIRNNLKIKYNDEIEIFVKDNSIILKEYEPSCIFCRKIKDLTTYKNQIICKKCIRNLSKS
jgi:transcriptional regulator, abrB family